MNKTRFGERVGQEIGVGMQGTRFREYMEREETEVGARKMFFREWVGREIKQTRGREER